MNAMTKCPKCGGKCRTRHVPKYHYRESGLDEIWLRGKGVLETTCGDCGGRFTSVFNEDQLLQVIAMNLLMSQGFLTGKEIRYLREACGLTQEALAKQLGKSRRESIAEWESQAEPNKDQALQYFLRAVLLRSFLGAVEEKRHLSKQQLAKLLRYSEGFLEEVVSFLSPKPRPPLSLVKPTEKKAWENSNLKAA